MDGAAFTAVTPKRAAMPIPIFLNTDLLFWLCFIVLNLRVKLLPHSFFNQFLDLVFWYRKLIDMVSDPFRKIFFYFFRPLVVDLSWGIFSLLIARGEDSLLRVHGF